MGHGRLACFGPEACPAGLLWTSGLPDYVGQQMQCMKAAHRAPSDPAAYKEAHTPSIMAGRRVGGVAGRM